MSAWWVFKLLSGIIIANLSSGSLILKCLILIILKKARLDKMGVISLGVIEFKHMLYLQL